MNGKLLFLFTYAIVFLGEISACTEFLGATILGQLKNIALLLMLVFFNKKIFTSLDKWSLRYVILMFMAFLGHLIIDLDRDVNPFHEFTSWCSIVIILSLYRKKLFGSPILPFFILMCFFLIEFSFAVYERITLSNIITFHENDFYNFAADTFSEDKEFRSRSLLYHPLTNANVVSIIMGFILVNKNMRKEIKYILLAIGIIALFSFNSRGAMLCWILILLYRFFFMKKKFVYIGIFIFFFYITVPIILPFIQENGIFGRLSFDFSDDSSGTRILAFVLFGEQEWDLSNIIFGGKFLTMPGSNLSIENGVLLTLAYWGWIVGTLKLLIEFIISYKCLSNYDAKEKMIVLFSFWGVAMMNNNVFSPLFLIFYILIFIAFDVFDNKIIKLQSTKNAHFI